MATVVPENLKNDENSGDNGDTDSATGKITSKRSRRSIIEHAGADSYEATVKEAKYVTGGTTIEERDDDALRNFTDKVTYFVENALAAYPGSQLYALGVLFLALLIVFTLIFYLYVRSCQRNDSCTADFNESFGYDFNIGDCFYFILQVLAVGGAEMDSRREGYRFIFFITIFVGLIVWAILVGFITEMVQSFMENLNKGKSKVVEKGHTLILGWNEATVRAVTQIAYLRRQWKEMNNAPLIPIPFLSMFMTKGTFKSTTIEPSTKVASSTVVLICNTLEKEEMQDRIREGLSERGMSSNTFQIGSDLICRLGDPSSVHDLVKVGVMYASAILCMMTEQDEQEFEMSGGKIENGATLRTLLAIRHILFTTDNVLHFDQTAAQKKALATGNYGKSMGGLNAQLRIVVQLSSPCPYIEAACFKNSEGDDMVFPIDLNTFMSSLLFACAGQKGLESVLMELFNFDGVAIRRRPAVDLIGGVENKIGGMKGMKFGDACKWVHNSCLIGVTDLKNARNAEDGLAPAYDRVITERDLIIFLDDNSVPEWDPQALEKFENAKNKYNELKSLVKKEDEPSLPLENTLICGWREAWSDNVLPIKKIIEETAQDCAVGSRLTFINGVEPSEFKDYMLECGYKIVNNQEPYTFEWEGKHIEHIHGDAASLVDLQPVVNARPYHVAIIMGTQSTGSLNAHSRDTRVMGMLLLLRQLINVKRSKSNNPDKDVPHMHIIGENQEDLTSLLALTPRANTKIKQLKSDFVNTQAIAARILVQTLSYPTISYAVGALFDEAPGKSNLCFVPVGGCIPFHKEITYSTIKLFVEKHFEGEAFVICVGVAIAPQNAEESQSAKIDRQLADGTNKTNSSLPFEILPADHKIFTFKEGDRIICIHRDHPKLL